MRSTNVADVDATNVPDSRSGTDVAYVVTRLRSRCPTPTLLNIADGAGVGQGDDQSA